MYVYTVGFKHLILIWGEKKTISLQPEDIKEIIIYTGKTGLTPDTNFVQILIGIMINMLE